MNSNKKAETRLSRNLYEKKNINTIFFYHGAICLFWICKNFYSYDKTKKVKKNNYEC